MAKFYTYHHDMTAVGGYEHRLTTDGTTVNVQCRSPHASTFRTFFTLELSDVEERFGDLLNNPYRNSAAAYEIFRDCGNPYA